MVEEVTISAIPRERVSEIWSLAVPFLCRVLEYNGGEYALEDLEERLRLGEQQLFMAHRGSAVLAAITAEIIHYPRKTICGLVAAGGDHIDEWLDKFMAVITPIAKEQGADEIRIAGRAGWERKVKKYGFAKSVTILGRAI